MEENEERKDNPMGNGAGAPIPKVRTVYDMQGVKDYLQMRRGNTAPLREAPDNVETTAHHLVQETAILHHNINISGQAIAEAAARTTARIAATPVPEEPAETIDVAPLRRIAREAETTAVESYNIAAARRNRRNIIIYGTAIATVVGVATWWGLRPRNNTPSGSPSVLPTSTVPSNPRNLISANASLNINVPETSWFKGFFTKK
jgi:hypothetical protein